MPSFPAPQRTPLPTSTNPPPPIRRPRCAWLARAALLAVGLALALGSCGGSDPTGTKARSALIVTLDTTRPDAVSFDSCPVVSTPVLDALARGAVVYERARTTAPLTRPSHASMMTGLYPLRHGVRDNGTHALSEEAVTLAELARDAGLETAAFVAAAVLDGRFGLAQGFDVYDQLDDGGGREATFAERPATDVVASAVRWLRERDAERPFLAWVHVFDPHAPYEAEERFVEQVGGHPYVAEVAAADRALGGLFAELERQGRLADTLIVVVADHGEDLQDHGVPTHGGYCYDSTIRVPMLVRWPDGHRAGERSNETVSVVDVFPTVARALGLPEPDGHDGLALQRPVPEGRGVYFESYYGFLHFGWSPLAGWAAGESKYLHSSAPEYYDLARDPGERSDAFREGDARHAAHRAALSELAARPRLTGARAELTDELTAELRQLGYATGAAEDSGALPDPLAPSDRPAPRDRLAARRDYLDAVDAVERGEVGRAQRLLEPLVAENPRHLYAQDLLGLCLVRQRRWSEGIDLLRDRLAKGPGQPSTYVNLGFALESTGELVEAARLYRRALELDPRNETATENLRRVQDTLGL